MTNSKYISTTLPYLNSAPHIGHAFEFVLADVIARYHRGNGDNVLFNVGVDEHGQKIQTQAIKEGYENTKDYCDKLAIEWEYFTALFDISHDNFYRTTDPVHAAHVRRYLSDIGKYIYTGDYTGQYCVGCEAYVTKREAVDGKCPTHGFKLTETTEKNKLFNLIDLRHYITNVLVDTGRSKELENIFKDEFNLSITRNNVDWGIKTEDGDTLYVWIEALLNYAFAAGLYTDNEKFRRYWSDSLIICGKDNLKFQAYILQALLVANDLPQTKEVLVHGTILDEHGTKMSKSIGNVIDPVEQYHKFGSDPVRYYLTFGLSTTGDSRYSEEDLVKKWNDEVVSGLGNLISRTLHLIDIREVDTTKAIDDNEAYWLGDLEYNIKQAFKDYNFREVNRLLVQTVNHLNGRISNEKPYDKDCKNYAEILNEVYTAIRMVTPYYGIVLSRYAGTLERALNSKKKAIIFDKIELQVSE